MSSTPPINNAEIAAGNSNSRVANRINCLGLNHLNWLNIISFVLNVIVTYGVGTMGWFGAKTNSELSDKYQTLITPKGTAFSIWAVIFTFQAIFTGVQALPKIRGSDIVQNGVGYFYVSTCIFQSVWGIAFGTESIALSLAFMIGIWFSLFGLVYSQYKIASDGSLFDFWCLRFPFSIHFGWITAATLLNLNVIFVSRGSTAAIQLAASIVSLAVLHAFSVWVLFYLSMPNYTLAGVVAWASWWIHIELKSPNSLIIDTFSTDAVNGVSYAAAAISVVVLTQIAVRVFTNSMELLKSDSNMVYSSSGAQMHPV